MRVSQLQRQLLANSATVLQQVGITNAQYDILNYVYNHTGRTQKELATTLVVTKEISPDHHKDGKTGSDQKKTSR